MIVQLAGRIDSDNAADTEKNILRMLEGYSHDAIVFDAKDLLYISSAGLRVILRLKKSYPDITVINVSSGVYEIFEMTGFNQFLKIERAYREISTEGCEVIGQGANGTIYRIDKDNVVKVYDESESPDNIKQESDVAKFALLLGIPTAISYEVVKVGNCYGSVFEMINAASFTNIIINEPDRIDWCVKESVDLLKKIHEITAPAGKLPDMKEKAIMWADEARPLIPEEAVKKFVELIKAIPDDDHVIHGDYHTKNMMYANDELLLIDMETLSCGHPIFEFSAMYNAYVGFSEFDHDNMMYFQGYDYDTACALWKKSLASYFETDDEAFLRDVERKASVIGYLRMIRFVSRNIKEGDERKSSMIDRWKNRFLEELGQIDSLMY